MCTRRSISSPSLVASPTLPILPPRRLSMIDNAVAKQLCVKRTRAESMTPNKTSLSTASRAKFSYKSRPPVLQITSSAQSPAARTLEALHNSEPIHENPYMFLRSLLSDSDEDVNSLISQPLHDSEFIEPADEQISAYDNTVVSAVRSNDIQQLREFHSHGRKLHCCNKFGESLLHLACRRGNADTVSFLIKEAKVSPIIRDDYGRTPLHDACWRGTPEFDIVQMLLSAEPRLAFVQDVRGHKPFEYTRKEHWEEWKEFLHRNKQLVIPRKLSTTQSKCIS